MYWRLHHSPPALVFLSSCLSPCVTLSSFPFYGKIYHLRAAYFICFIEITSRARPLLSNRGDNDGERGPDFIATIFEDLPSMRSFRLLETLRTWIPRMMYYACFTYPRLFAFLSSYTKCFVYIACARDHSRNQRWYYRTGKNEASRRYQMRFALTAE